MTQQMEKKEIPEALERLAGLIRVKTESQPDYSLFDTQEFSRFPRVFEETYPGAVKVLERIPMGDLALLYRWSGSDPSLPPVLFMGHYDVVGAAEEEWSHPPFAGVIHGDFLYGRGTQDIKCHLGGYFEAVSLLASEGFVPRRTIYFAFGGDEEVAGREGAGKIAHWFRTRNIRFEFVLDEGGVISTDGMKVFTSRPAALVGIAEKGMASFRISFAGKSGHSSMPPSSTAIGRLAQAVCKIEKNPFPRRIDTSIDRLLREMAPHSRGIPGLLLKLYPLTRGILKAAFAKGQATDSMIRTTQAVTMISGGTRENVLPHWAESVVNFRILPGETVSSVQNRLKKVLSGLDVKIELYGGWPSNDPIPAPAEKTPAYLLLTRTISEVFPGVIPLPFLMNGSTDSKQFCDLSENIFRFTPIHTSSGDLQRVHGVDERISRENYEGMIRFYRVFIKTAAC